VGNQTRYSKQLIFQSSPDVEALIRDDNFKQIALLVDEYGINGSGAVTDGGLGAAGSGAAT
jgi:hypothetical protein